MPRSLSLPIALLLLILLAVAPGCGGGGGAGGDDAGRGAVAGHLFAAPDGRRVLGHDPTPPAGFAPAPNEPVRVAGGGEARTGPDGAFTLSGIPAGLATLEAGAANVPLTVVPGATVRVGAPPVTRDQAVAKVRAALASLTTPGAPLDLFACAQPLPAGVVVRSALDDRIALHTVAAESWFLYADPQPGARFGHDVWYFLVDARTGALARIDADAWPSLNGGEYYRIDGPVPAVHDVVQAATRAAAPPTTPAAPEPPLAPTRQAGDPPRTYLMTVLGDDRSDFEADPPRVGGLLAKMGLPPIAARDDIQSWKLVGDVGDALVRRFEALAARARSGDTFVFYLTTHGVTGQDVVGGTPTGPKRYHFTLQYTTPPTQGWGTSIRRYRMDPQRLNFSRTKACRIVVIADTCFSGHWIPLMSPRFTDLQGREMVVLTAADTLRPAAGLTQDIRVPVGGKSVPLGMGGLFTSALIHVFNGNVAGDSLYDRLHAGYAATLPIVDAYYGKYLITPYPNQNPQEWQRTLKEEELCSSGSQIITIR